MAPNPRQPPKARAIDEHHELLREKLNEERGQVKVPMRFLQEYLREEKINTEAFLAEDSFLTKRRHQSVDPNLVYDEFNPIFKKNVMNKIRVRYMEKLLMDLELKHRKGMKEVYYKVEDKMREYVIKFAGQA